MKILVVEDDELTAAALVATLANQNYTVETASDGEAGWELTEAFAYDLILLDVVLPKLDGISLCQKLRSQGYQMPILLLTARNSGHDKAVGLDAGADDYVVKPFDSEELAARIRALLRRNQATSQSVLEWGDLQLDPRSCEVTYATKPLSLTAKEYALLELFLRNSHRVFSCGAILQNLWSFEEIPSDEAVRTHIKGLRQKLKAGGAPTDLIETVYGIGYRLKAQHLEGGKRHEGDKKNRGKGEEIHDRRNEVRGLPLKGEELKNFSMFQAPSFEDPDNPKSKIQNPTFEDPDNPKSKIQNPKSNDQIPHSLSSASEPTRQQTLASIAKVWHRFKERVSEQVGVLETAVVALREPEFDRELLLQAKQEAHTLAGALGTFGLSEGSQLARRIEHTLQVELPLNQEQATHLREWVRLLRQEIERDRHGSQGKLGSGSGQDVTDFSTEAATADRRPMLLIVDRDRPLAEKLIAEAATWGFDAEVATNLTRAQNKIRLAPPDLVLLDPAISPTAAESLTLLAELQKQAPPIPVAIFTERDDLTQRLEVARLGARTFLPKSLSPAQVLEVIQQVLHRVDRAKATVMVVDDDPKLLEIVRSLLEPRGLKVTALDDPRLFWEVLEATSPDLLILDIEMPQISGIDLCQIVRNDSRWSGLPILLLAAHTDSETIDRVFAVGADDFASKPIVGPELVTRIINRLERIRFLQSLAVKKSSGSTCKDSTRSDKSE